MQVYRKCVKTVELVFVIQCSGVQREGLRSITSSSLVSLSTFSLQVKSKV